MSFFDIPPYGSGELITEHSGPPSFEKVFSPIALSDVHQTLFDNETNATIYGGLGNYVINEYGAGAFMAMAGGNQIIRDFGGDAKILGSNGVDHYIMGVNPSLGAAPITADTITLGTGQNTVFLGGSGNTVTETGGSDFVNELNSGSNTVAVGATGSSLTIAGFSLTNGDVLNLAPVLSGLPVNASNLGNYVSVASIGAGSHATTLLTIAGSTGTDTVKLLGTGPLSLSQLTAGSLAL